MAIASRASQDFVPIQEVRDGFLLLRDGSMRAIVLATSINFSLKSEDERTSIIYQFQDFLNSLDFPIQIFAESRRLDIRPYIALLEGRYKDQMEDLLKIQIQEYIGFIKSFTESTNIMTKSFFIVVPWSGVSIAKPSSLLPFSKRGTGDEKATGAFEENRAQIEQRIAVIEEGLSRTGVRVVRLGTDEVVELFYKLFNPGETDKPMKID